MFKKRQKIHILHEAAGPEHAHGFCTVNEDHTLFVNMILTTTTVSNS